MVTLNKRRNKKQNTELQLHFIIPLLCHFTKYGQENVQNMQP